MTYTFVGSSEHFQESQPTITLGSVVSSRAVYVWAVAPTPWAREDTCPHFVLPLSCVSCKAICIAMSNVYVAIWCGSMILSCSLYIYWFRV